MTAPTIRRCTTCGHPQWHHPLGLDCATRIITGPPTAADATATAADPHPGRCETLCGCGNYTDEPLP